MKEKIFRIEGRKRKGMGEEQKKIIRSLPHFFEPFRPQAPSICVIEFEDRAALYILS